jgi:hypothetical protein
MSTIFAIDLGKFKSQIRRGGSVACFYKASDATHSYRTLPTTPAAMHDLIVEVQPDRLVIEVGAAAGWVKDLCEALEVKVQVANPNGEAWRWKNIKRKTDKDDALKLAQLSAMGHPPTS